MYVFLKSVICFNLEQIFVNRKKKNQQGKRKQNETEKQKIEQGMFFESPKRN